MTDEELVTALQERLMQSGPLLWLVWTAEPRKPSGPRGLPLPEVRHPMVVVARSASGARKLWREWIFKHRPNEDVPTHCDARSIPADYASTVLATEATLAVQSDLGLHDTRP